MKRDIPSGGTLKVFLEQTFSTLDATLANAETRLREKEVGMVHFVGQGIVSVSGLPHVRSEELVLFPGNRLGLVFNVDPEEIGIVALDHSENISVGSAVRRTGRVLEVPVGEALLGRVVDPMGRPLDNYGEVHAARRLPLEREAPAIMNRAPVTIPLQTGIKVIDALIAIGRGQRELILGDRQTGKTALTLDTIINQKDKNVICIYCAIGKQSADTARVISVLENFQAMPYCIVVVAAGEDPPGLQYIAPYAATSMGEYFMERGQDVLIIYDDLTRHARSYRELSLLLRRPPGREAYPGDIFYIHARMLERATHLREELGGGSLTAIPIIETEGQDISAYIPTNLISITDGQIYLSSQLFQKGMLPAIDVGKSVSRVGGKTQLPAYRNVAGDLRLSYSQFEELETFSRFGARLDEGTRRTLERGRRVREILKQKQYRPLRVADQIAALLSVTGGALDDIPLESVGAAEMRIQQAVSERLTDLCARIEGGEPLSVQDRNSLLDLARSVVASELGRHRDADS